MRQTKWWTLAAVSVATFMLLLDVTVVNVALPSIRDDLGASFSDLQWVVDAYALTLAALVLTAGSLADRLGRRRVFVAGVALFTAASLLCALSPDPTFLILARGVQGIGGAAMFAVSLALIAHEFDAGRDRASALGVYGATIGVAVAVGPLLGGALTDALGWESIFLLNVPVGVTALAMTLGRVRESRDPDATRVDWAGTATFSLALLALVYALVRGNDDGWGSPRIVALLSAFAVLLVAFVAIERRVTEPMLPLGLFRRPAFTGAQIAALAISGSIFSLFLYISLYLQNDLGLTPLQTGLRYLPITVAVFLFSPVAALLAARVAPRLLLFAGLATVAVGLLLMAGIDRGDDWTTLLPGFIVAGAGVGMLNPVIADVAVSVVPRAQSGMASGINDTFRQVGVAIGLAVWGAVFVGRGAHRVGELTGVGGGRARDLVEAVSSGALPASARGAVADAAREGFLSGLNEVFVLGAVVALAGALLCLALVRDGGEQANEIRHPVDNLARSEAA